jgi:hypothetical protein
MVTITYPIQRISYEKLSKPRKVILFRLEGEDHQSDPSLSSDHNKPRQTVMPSPLGSPQQKTFSDPPPLDYVSFHTLDTSNDTKQTFLPQIIHPPKT